jgi:hypothetical protein
MMSAESEKASLAPETPITPSNDRYVLYRPEVDTSHVNQKELMRRIDIHVIPWLAVLYFLNFLDRGSIGNAKVRRGVISLLPS